MEFIENGSILTPRGFSAGSAACGLKNGPETPDIALIVGEDKLSAAGVFTKNLFAAPPVLWCRAILPTDSLRAIAVNSGNANACNGQRGIKDTERMADIVAGLAGCRPVQVALASTGIIGRPLPLCKVEAGLRESYVSLSTDIRAARLAEKAIMTTDTRQKACAVSIRHGDVEAFIGGMAKGSGMIAPDMATMLAFITTDMSADAATLNDILSSCTKNTFNNINVDGDTSTNDSVFLAASGDSGLSLDNAAVRDRFCEALFALMRNLAIQIVSDGEGATKQIEIRACGCASQPDARLVAGSIANSLLVKCAINGEDPNWGRIICAAGYSGAGFAPDRVSLRLGDTLVVEDGCPTGKDASREMKSRMVKIEIDLGAGDEEATFWTCDISKRYVDINAEYTT